jgi:L-fuculose-phosphate aldolase
MDTVTAQKAEYHNSGDDLIKKHMPPMPAYTVQQKLAITCRLLAHEGHGSGIAGQITARGAQPGTFWTQRLGLGLEEITASNLILVDDNLDVLQGSGIPNPANRFHLWIYRARPEVNCIIHTHPFYCSALGMIGTPLAVSHMDATALYEDCAFLARWPGVPFGDEEGRIISEALGDKRAILLAHHGQLVACGAPEEAAVLAVEMEHTAKMQLAAMAAGNIVPIEPPLARHAHDLKTRARSTDAYFGYYARRTLRTDAECLN